MLSEIKLIKDFNLLKYKTVLTTMDIASKKIQKNQQNIIIVAEKQTKGVGRLNRSWASPKGNLYCSIGIYMKNPTKIENIYQSSFFLSLTIANTIETIYKKSQSNQLCDIKCKWPNDVYINDKKISGILIRSILDDTNTIVKAVIIGVGINTNKSIKNINSISLNDIGISTNAEDFLIELINQIEINALIYNENFDLLRKEWIKRAYKINEIITIKKSDENYLTGVFTEIDLNGSIILNNDNEIITVSYGDII